MLITHFEIRDFENAKKFLSLSFFVIPKTALSNVWQFISSLVSRLHVLTVPSMDEDTMHGPYGYSISDVTFAVWPMNKQFNCQVLSSVSVHVLIDPSFAALTKIYEWKKELYSWKLTKLSNVQMFKKDEREKGKKWVYKYPKGFCFIIIQNKN